MVIRCFKISFTIFIFKFFDCQDFLCFTLTCLEIKLGQDDGRAASDERATAEKYISAALAIV